MDIKAEYRRVTKSLDVGDMIWVKYKGQFLWFLCCEEGSFSNKRYYLQNMNGISKFTEPISSTNQILEILNREATSYRIYPKIDYEIDVNEKNRGCGCKIEQIG